MTLESEYNKVKKEGLWKKRKDYIIHILIGLGQIGLFLWIVQLLWNYVGNKFGFPKLSFIEFYATVLLIVLLKILLNCINLGMGHVNGQNRYIN